MEQTNENHQDTHLRQTAVSSRIIRPYRITYDNGVTQIKNLISQIDFEAIIKPKQKEIYELEIADKKKEANAIKSELKAMFSDNYFTDKSPLFNAHLTGYLELPKVQGGIKPCLVAEI